MTEQAADATARLLDAAQAIGIEIDRDEAQRWIEAVSAESAGMLTVDVSTGVYGHRVTMEDHDPVDRQMINALRNQLALDR